MTAAPGPQQPDEVRTLGSWSRAECLAAADVLEGAVHLVDDDEAAETLAQLADQWRAQAELVPAAPSAQPDECRDCGHRHAVLAYCKARQCSACGQEAPGGGLCSDCSMHPTTEARKPDEVRRQLEEAWEGGYHAAKADSLAREDGTYLPDPPNPFATPPPSLSQQRRHTVQDGELFSRLYEWLGRYSSEPGGDEWNHEHLRDIVSLLLFDIPIVLAQPVRDTGEGRR